MAGQRSPESPSLAGSAPDGARHDAFGLPTRVVGNDLALDEAPDLLAEEVVLGGEQGTLKHGS
jgi:hypothetical protein